MAKKLLNGYSTGSCATAGTVAAILNIFDENPIDSVVIKNPQGIDITVPVKSVKGTKNSVRAEIKKFSGDDPDITNGAIICTRVTLEKEFSETDLAKGYLLGEGQILVTGGRGVGIVTKKGIQSSVGKYAINPGPLNMIERNLKVLIEKFNIKEKLLVKVFVPLGRELGKKTLNGKLGIIGGISILGTTGIVKPMSEEALTESLAIELKVIRDNYNQDWAVFAFGNYGERFCTENGIQKDRIVTISNYVGFMLEKAKELGIKKILLVGHIAKGVKVAGGIFNTHSKIADARMEIMAANCFLSGEKHENILKILESNTIDEACDYVTEKKVFNLIAEKAAKRSSEHVKGDLQCEVLLFSYSGEILGYSEKFYQLVGEILGKN